MPKYIPLKKEFFETDTLTVAKRLLGKYFVRNLHGHMLVGRIVETEAYHQEGDPSCHAHRGKTPRNEVMFGPSGRLYVYFTYGMHFCMNIVTESEGIAAAVLIRALEPIDGIEQMQKLRGEKISLKNLASGPAKLCQAFGINRAQNGHDLASPDIFIGDAPDIPDTEIIVSKRIGLTQGVDLPWRFYIRGNEFVSRILKEK